MNATQPNLIIEASLSYTVDANHPDYRYIAEPGKSLHVADTYTIDPTRFASEDDLLAYIRHDLALVAGGGYDTKHIHHCQFHWHDVATA